MHSENPFSKGKPPDELLTALQITSDDQWDVIIVGDGSGSRWNYPGGWASIIFDRVSGRRKTLYGALSDTTINICELFPYLYSLQWYARGPGKVRQEENIRTPLIVHIVTDCKVLVNQGSYGWSRDTNLALWAGIDSFKRLNYRITWHFYERDTFAANRACDSLSKQMRHLITNIEQRLDVLELPDAYDDNCGRVQPV